MKATSKFRIIGLFLFVSLYYSSSGQVDPQKKYKELFQEIQKNKIFSDQKRFVDCELKGNPDSIVKVYLNQKNTIGFNLKNFVAQHFDTIQNDTTAILQHINYLWTDLTKERGAQKKFSSLLLLY